MRNAFFDCFSGASGDMIMAACLSAGADLQKISKDLATLGLEGYRIEAQPVCKQGFAATQFDVHIDPSVPKPHRHLKHVLQIIQAGRLPQLVRTNAERIFTRLAEAEAKVHGTTVEKIHFHEVGAVDAIVDIVGTCLALDQLGIEQIAVSLIPPGSGTVPLRTWPVASPRSGHRGVA